MIWITRSHVHVDRVACPWLISRFVDSEAEFLFVAKNQVEETAKVTGAIPFDAPGVELGHKDGKCSFEAIIEKYGLTDKALLLLAKIVHAADVDEDLHTNAIAPGFFLTNQNYYLLVDEKTGEATPRGNRILDHTPMGRYGAPSDLIGTLIWLVSDASAFVNGAVVPVDGAFNAYCGV